MEGDRRGPVGGAVRAPPRDPQATSSAWRNRTSTSGRAAGDAPAQSWRGRQGRTRFAAAGRARARLHGARAGRRAFRQGHVHAADDHADPACPLGPRSVEDLRPGGPRRAGSEHGGGDAGRGLAVPAGNRRGAPRGGPGRRDARSVQRARPEGLDALARDRSRGLGQRVHPLPGPERLCLDRERPVQGSVLDRGLDRGARGAPPAAREGHGGAGAGDSVPRDEPGLCGGLPDEPGVFPVAPESSRRSSSWRRSRSTTSARPAGPNWPAPSWLASARADRAGRAS